MLKRIALVYVIVAAIVAVVTSILQVQPALFFIDLLVGDDNKFPAKLAMLLTMLALILPALIIILLINLVNKRNGNQMPDLTGKTGVVVRREWALVNGIYNDKVMINGEKRSTVSNGKSTFVELPGGDYKVFVKGATTQSPVMDVSVAAGQIIRLKTGYVAEPNGIKSRQYLETDL